MKHLKKLVGRQGKVASGQLAEKSDQSVRSLIKAIRELHEECGITIVAPGMSRLHGRRNFCDYRKTRELASETLSKIKILKQKKTRGRKEISVSSPEFIEHETVVKMEPKARVRVELTIREFRKAQPPKIAEPEVLIDA